MGALRSQGTTLHVGGYEVGQVESIQAVNLSADVADVTHLLSGSGYEEARSTVLRSGELVFSVVFDPDLGAHTGRTYRALGQSQLVTVTFSNTNVSTWVIWAACTGASITAEVAESLRAEFTFKCTGAGTFTN